MKTNTYLNYLILLFFLTSCSTEIEPINETNATDDQETVDTEETDNNEDPEEEANPITEADSFNYSYDGEVIGNNDWFGQKVENTISINASAPDGTTIYLEFNKFGNLGKISSYSSMDFDFPDAGNYTYYKSRFFDFELVHLDEENNKVEVVFSGKLYEDPYDPDSAFHEVEGNFVASYVETEPNIAGLGTYAKINGETWYDTDSFQAGGFMIGENITLYQFNDGKYTIAITTNQDTTSETSYSFEAGSAVNHVGLSRYKETTHEFVDYSTAGMLTITEKIVGPQLSFIKGEFSLTATDPDDNSLLEVTDGTFYLVYGSY